MSQRSDLANLPDTSGAVFLSNLNANLAALASHHSGPSAPPSKFAYMTWYDTTANALKVLMPNLTTWALIGTFNTGTGHFTPAREGTALTQMATTPYSRLTDVEGLADSNTQDMVTHAARLNAIEGGTGNDEPYLRQVKSATKKNTFVLSNDATWTDIPGLSVGITPLRAGSKVLVQASVSGAGLNSFCSLRLMRGGAVIGQGDAASSRSRGAANLPLVGSGAWVNGVPLMHLDSPNTTSALTYKVQVKVDSGTGFAVINRSADDLDFPGYLRGASSITVMEVQE